MNILKKLLFVIPIIILTTLIDMIISFVFGGMIMLEMLEAGCKGYKVEVITLVVAATVYTYIQLHGKIRNLIKKESKTNE